VFGTIAMLVAASVRYDFGRCLYPSPAYPYFAVGRLAVAALVPLLLAVLVGWERLVRGRVSPARQLVLVAMAGVALLGHAGWLASRVATSGYNWFHLP